MYIVFSHCVTDFANALEPAADDEPASSQYETDSDQEEDEQDDVVEEPNTWNYEEMSEPEDDDNQSNRYGLSGIEALGVREVPEGEKWTLQFHIAVMNCIYRHNISHEAAKELLDLYQPGYELYDKMMEETGGKAKKYRMIRHHVSRYMVPVKIDICYRDLERNEIVVLKDQTKFPRKLQLEQERYELLWETSRVCPAQVLKLHDRTCKKGPSGKSHCGQIESMQTSPRAISTSIDDVPQDASSHISLSVVSMKLQECSTVYNVTVHRPTLGNAKAVHPLTLLVPVVTKLIDSRLKIDSIVADAPMRSCLRKSINHNGWYFCQFCTYPGVSLRRKLKRKKVLRFPYVHQRRTNNKLTLKRTHETWNQQAHYCQKNQIDSNRSPKLTADLKKLLQGEGFC